jgi:hypothetical protein
MSKSFIAMLFLQQYFSTPRIKPFGHGQHSSKFVIRVVLLLIVMFYVLFMCKWVLPPGVNPIAVDKYINQYQFTKQTSKWAIVIQA